MKTYYLDSVSVLECQVLFLIIELEFCAMVQFPSLTIFMTMSPSEFYATKFNEQPSKGLLSSILPPFLEMELLLRCSSCNFHVYHPFWLRIVDGDVQETLHKRYDSKSKSDFELNFQNQVNYNIELASLILHSLFL